MSRPSQLCDRRIDDRTAAFDGFRETAPVKARTSCERISHTLNGREFSLGVLTSAQSRFISVLIATAVELGAYAFIHWSAGFLLDLAQATASCDYPLLARLLPN